MNSFDLALLDSVLDSYENSLEASRPNELYKWDAIGHFQKHWNPDAEDFHAMLEAAFSAAGNLLTGAMYYPLGMLLEFAKEFPENVRDALNYLFDESLDLHNRLETFYEASQDFLTKLNERRESRGEEPALHAFQDPRAMMVYLAFRHPDKHYLYKSTMYVDFARALGVDTVGNKYDKVAAYEGLCDETLAYLTSKHPELIERSDSLLTGAQRGADPAHHLLVQDIAYHVSSHANLADNTQDEDSERGYWIYAPGDNASLWDECLEEGVMPVGWDELGNLADYASREEITERLQEIEQTDSSKKNDSLACWQFQNTVKPGDIVYARKGRDSIIGRGIVSSEAFYDESREYYRNTRKVQWTHNGTWESPQMLNIKTLTDISGNAALCNTLEAMFATDNASLKDDVAYWWLVANATIWSFKDLEVGAETSYTLKNENGNPRRIQKHYLAAKPGDIIVGYESAPLMRVVAICEVAREHDDERMYFRKLRNVEGGITFKDIKSDDILSKMEFAQNPNGSFFALTPTEYERVRELIDVEDSPVAVNLQPYTEQDFLEDVYMDADKLHEALELLDRKRNLILQGSPGTGKTFAAKRLAYVMLGQEDESHIKMVQFHQNSNYDDFVYGYRPTEVGGFETKPGTFVEFCRRAAARPNEKFFFIIDEINRANISKAFGELLMLIEADHRDENITLTVSDEPFSVPNNLFIIGMMNTADRGLALIDYALRRRFAFFEMEPALSDPKFRRMLERLGSDKLINLVDATIQLNNTIASDPSLGPEYRIGHSYFCVGEDADEDVAMQIVRYELAPLIREYWFDNRTKAASECAKLEAAAQ